MTEDIFMKSIYDILMIKNNPNIQDKLFLLIRGKIEKISSLFYEEFLVFLKEDKFIKKNYSSISGKIDLLYLIPIVNIFNDRKRKTLLSLFSDRYDFKLFSEKLHSISFSVPDQKKSNFDAWISSKKPEKFKKKSFSGDSELLFDVWELDFFRLYPFKGLVFSYLEDPVFAENRLHSKYQNFIYQKHLEELL